MKYVRSVYVSIQIYSLAIFVACAWLNFSGFSISVIKEVANLVSFFAYTDSSPSVLWSFIWLGPIAYNKNYQEFA